MSAETMSSPAKGELVRSIDWRGAFWVASGVPALVLFSIGGIAGTVGIPAFAIWAVSMVMGFIQSFTYAEIAGLFPNKSGGASVYGAAAWLKYGKFIAPLSVWCNWIAWTPVLSLGSAIAAGYILGIMEPAPAAEAIAAEIARSAAAGTVIDDAAAIVNLMPLHNWSLFTIDLGVVVMSFNWTFVIGTILMLLAFAIQHRGILGTAKVQTVVGLIIVLTLFIVGVVPFFNGNFDSTNFSPFVPLAVPYAPEPGAWNIAGWTLILGGMFIAAWSTYGFETAICYTSEFKNPETDTFKAIFYSGLLCLVLFILVPITFQGYLGLTGMLDGGVVAGTGVADVMARMVGGGHAINVIFVFLMIASLILIIITAMAGSSRTLYQGSVDGWLPKYLSHVNHNGAPTGAMWTDLVFNLILLSIASTDATAYYFILAVSNCGYIIFNFLNLNAGWIHRIDSGHVKRPFKAPTIILAIGTVLAFVNAMFMGAGAKVWNANALLAGFIAAALIIPVFWFRHYVQDKGKFPDRMLDDLGIKDAGHLGEKKAGMLPYVTLAGGVAVVLISNWIFTG
ncbi:APC family permease [Dongia sp.]|jgi:amino acid transporter|uniref:APC family permease n=1 Tax=Dongia sp. TaxID=1977262 RepID=UPI0035B28BC1